LRKDGGYTILEMSAVLALLAVFTMLAIPQVRHISRCELDAASRLMAADLRMIRQEAITTGTACTAQFFVYEDHYLLKLPAETKVIALPAGVSFKGQTTFPGEPPSVRFNNLGRPTSGGTVILRAAGGEKRYVILAPVTGRVRISNEPPEHW